MKPGPFWWENAPTEPPRTEVRWQAGIRYERTWRADGTYIDQISYGKAITSGWGGTP